MPDLDFKVTGVEAAVNGAVPLIHFKLEVTNTPETDPVQSVLLQTQIQIHPTQRAYTPAEKEKLIELFGPPDQWGQTLRARLWAHANTTVRGFSHRTETILPVPCTYDLNVAATKYFYALEEGEVPLLFLFSGTIFYENAEGRLQIQQVSWNKECAYRMPIATWQAMMDQHYPNRAFITLERDVFDRLYQYRRRARVSTWEEALGQLLQQADAQQTTPVE